MSDPDNENLGNAVMADDEGAGRDPDYSLSPAASAPTSESECDVVEASETSTEDEGDFSSDSQDEPCPWDDAFNDAAATHGVRTPRDEEDSVECEDHFEELNSFAMASQGNLHTLAVFPRPGYGNTGSNLLVATLSRQIYTMGFTEYDPQKSKMEDLRYLSTYVLRSGLKLETRV